MDIDIEKEGNDAANYLLVAAIDIGTTFSGYAFSFKETEQNPKAHEEIRVNKSWGEGLGFQTYKTPTSVLTDKNGEFVAFGFEAEQRYCDALNDDGLPPDVIIFRHFKMELHHCQDLTMDLPITAVDGTEMPAVDIISHCIRFLKDHMLSAIKIQHGSLPPEDMIRWVITVPAIWSEKSKKFMRQAAFQAGCISEKDSHSLVIALEPEAGSLCCRRLSVTQFECDKDISFPPGTKYLVLDCGGGTVDITAHQIEDDNTVRELLKASGGAWGGTEVDRNFIALMQAVLGKSFMEKFHEQCPQEWLQFATSFEKAKKAFTPEPTSKIVVPLLWAMSDSYSRICKKKPIQNAFKKSESKEGVMLRNGSIVISHETAKKLFEPVVAPILKHVHELLKTPKLLGLEYIMMVGGFSESRILQEAVKSAFENNVMKILIPDEAQLAIIKGAVLYGHRPQEIKSRIARRNYGCAVLTEFDRELHDPRRKYTDSDGIAKCDNVFFPLVKMGEEIAEGYKVKQVMTAWSNQTSITFNIFETEMDTDACVFYTDEPGMTKVGYFRLDGIEVGAEQEIELTLLFGRTEIEASALDLATGMNESTTIDFLSDAKY